MSSTASSALRRSAANGAARRTSVVQLVDVPRVHRAPSRRSAGPARPAGCAGSAATRSGRPASARRPPPSAPGRRGTSGRSRRGETAPTWWPARPTRCRPLATDGGDSTWIDQVDRAHVDAELEAGGGDHGRQPAGLQLLLDQCRAAPWTPSRGGPGPAPARGAAARPPDCAMICGRAASRRPRGAARRSTRSSCDLVEPGAQPLGQPAGVGEHDRRPVRLRPGRRSAPRRAARSTCAAPRPAAEPLDLAGRSGPARPCPRPGTTTSSSMVLADGGCTTSTSWRAAEEPGDLLDRADRGGQPDPLGRPLEQLVEPLERQRQVRAALGAGHRVHLVDDHRLDTAQRLAGLAGEHQEQRLGRGDEDVGRACGRTGGARRPGCRRSGRRP